VTVVSVRGFPSARAIPSVDRTALKAMCSRTIRILIIAAVTGLAFRGTLADLAAFGRDAPSLMAVVAVPVAVGVAATGIALRGREGEPPINDRQVDVIVAAMGLLMAITVYSMLIPVYEQQFGLLRPDLFALWIFSVSSAVLLFGLRPVLRYRRAWALPLLAFPLPYHLLVVLVGDTRLVAGGFTVMMAALAVAVAGQRGIGGITSGAAVGWAAGMAVFAGMLAGLPEGPLAVQILPALAAVAAVAWVRRRRLPSRSHTAPSDRRTMPRMRPVLPLLIGAAAVVALLPLRTFADPVGIGPAHPHPQDGAPGWQVTDHLHYPWAERLFGEGASLHRQKMVAENGNPLWNRLSRPRHVVVDTTETRSPRSLEVYPSAVLYGVSAMRWSAPRPVTLGHGVDAALYSIVDDRLLVTWNILEWTWNVGGSVQRISVSAVDNHDADAPFPEPTPTLVPTMGRMFTVLFRGEQAAIDNEPVFKDAEMLIEVGRGLLDQHLGLRDLPAAQ